MSGSISFSRSSTHVLQQTPTAKNLSQSKPLNNFSLPVNAATPKRLMPKSQAPVDIPSETKKVHASIDTLDPTKASSNASKFKRLGLMPSVLRSAKLNLRPVSQHQVMFVQQGTDKTVTESGRSVKLAQGAVPFNIGIELKSKGHLEIVGHGSPDGKTIGGQTPQQLAKQIKAGGIKELAVLDLKSCHSHAFKAELQQSLAAEGIQVGDIKVYEGSIAISRQTGSVVSEGAMLTPHDGNLGKYSTAFLQQKGVISAPILIPLPDGSTTEGLEAVFYNSNGNPAEQVNGKNISVYTDSIQTACATAYGEYLSGTLVKNLTEDSGAFLSAHVQPFLDGNEADLQKIMDANMLSAKFGYLIEDRMTQLLVKHAGSEFSMANFQQTRGYSRPDIVVEHLRVDVTSAESVGHILDKDPSAWFAEDLMALEVTYPSIKGEAPENVMGRLKSGVAIDIKALEQAKADFAAEKDLFNSTVDDTLRDLNSEAKQHIKDHPILGDKRKKEARVEDYIAQKMFPVEDFEPGGSAHEHRALVSNLLSRVSDRKVRQPELIVKGVNRILEVQGIDTSITARHLYSSYSYLHE